MTREDSGQEEQKHRCARLIFDADHWAQQETEAISCYGSLLRKSKSFCLPLHRTMARERRTKVLSALQHAQPLVHYLPKVQLGTRGGV